MRPHYKTWSVSAEAQQCSQDPQVQHFLWLHPVPALGTIRTSAQVLLLRLVLQGSTGMLSCSSSKSPSWHLLWSLGEPCITP